MARVKALSAYKMAKRIFNREDNVYDKKVITKQMITNILRGFWHDGGYLTMPN